MMPRTPLGYGPESYYFLKAALVPGTKRYMTMMSGSTNDVSEIVGYTANRMLIMLTINVQNQAQPFKVQSP